MTPFAFVEAISFSKKNLIEENPSCQKDYIPFIVNKSLSYFPDVLFYVNEINRLSNLEKTMQFSFLLNTISKRKRFAKWIKKDNELVMAVSKYYQISSRKAQEIVPLLSKEQIKTIKGTNEC